MLSGLIHLGKRLANKPNGSNVKRSADLWRLALLQTTMTCAFALVAWFCFGRAWGLSAFFGGTIAALANSYVAWGLQRKQHKRLRVSASTVTPEERLQWFYQLEVSKTVITVMLMAFWVVVARVSFLPFIVAYGLSALIVTWLYFLLPVETQAHVAKKHKE